MKVSITLEVVLLLALHVDKHYEGLNPKASNTGEHEL